jgi:hypothetical protein
VSAKFNRCTIQIRKLPLETFRLPRDGRKWKQLARSRYGLLLEISTFANGDGSFLSPDPKINFSPSFTKLLVHRSRDTLYRLANDIRELGLLSWHRNNHYGRRFYEIHLPEKQVRYSPENRSDIRGENRSDIQNNTSDQEDVITGPTSRPYPSLESLPSGGSPSASPPFVSDANQFCETGGEHASHHHRFSPNTENRKPKPDDDECVSPRAVVPETPEIRIQRLKDSALAKIKIKYGLQRPDDDSFIRDQFDEYESNAKRPPISENFFLTAFDNEFSGTELGKFENLDREGKVSYWANKIARGNPALMEKAAEDVRRLVDESGNFSSSENCKAFGQLIIDSGPTSTKPLASHDELLKDENNYGKLQWAGRYIVARAPAAVARFLTRDTVQALTGCSAEHMVEHLRTNGFWAEVYQPGGEASHVSDTPEPPAKTEPPPSPENNSPDTELPETYEEAVALLQFENPEFDHDQAWERIEHFANRTGEFSDEEKWQGFVELLRRLRVEQRQATEQRQAKRAARNQRRRKRRQQRRTAGP